MDKQLLRIPEVAELCGLSRAKTYELISGPTPEIRAIKIGRSRRVPVDEVRAFIARQMAEQHEPS